MCVHGVDVVDSNWQSFDGKTALLLAAAEGHSSSVQLLLQHGADVNLSDCMQEASLLAGRIVLCFIWVLLPLAVLLTCYRQHIIKESLKDSG